jgi:hypothetical protein
MSDRSENYGAFAISLRDMMIAEHGSTPADGAVLSIKLGTCCSGSELILSGFKHLTHAVRANFGIEKVFWENVVGLMDKAKTSKAKAGAAADKTPPLTSNFDAFRDMCRSLGLRLLLPCLRRAGHRPPGESQSPLHGGRQTLNRKP